MSEPHGLNPRQERFLASILEGKSATQSAIEAGYAERSASVTGARMLRNPLIQAKIQGTLKKTDGQQIECSKRWKTCSSRRSKQSPGQHAPRSSNFSEGMPDCSPSGRKSNINTVIPSRPCSTRHSRRRST